MTKSETLQYELKRITAQADEAIDIAEAALVLASVNQPDPNLQTYRDHLKAVANAVTDAAKTADLKPDTAKPEDMAAVLSRVLAQDFRYAGDEDTYDDLDNANLMRVIDRRKGLPITLGILYLAAARAQRWEAVGLSFPGYFLIRLESRDGRRTILDPFHGGRIMEAPQLRELLKVMSGAAVELEADHYKPVSNRDVLVRLQNNVKIRHLELGESEGALEALKCMQVLNPDDPNVWRETGVINMRLGYLKRAVEAFEHFVAQAPEGPDQAKISVVVSELRERLH